MRWRKIGQDRWAFWGWVVLGLGVLLLAVGLPLSLWLATPATEETTAPGLPATDSASLTDTAELEVRRGDAAATGSPQPEPSGGGGSGEVARVTDSVRFVVRDAEGNIKEQGVAE